MQRFKTFINAQQKLLEASYGITHIEELPIESFMRMIKNLNTLHAVQKLDGANLLLGIDENGKVFTSREQKGGKRFYKESDFPNHSAYDGFKAATMALMEVSGVIKKMVKRGQAISCEVLFGPQPNTVIYGKDSLNYVAFLEAMAGDDPTAELDRGLPRQLAKALKGKKVTVTTKVTDTTDGINLVKTPMPTTWEFTASDIVPSKHLQDADISGEIAKLEKFLNADNKAARAQGADLSNYDVLKTKEREYSDERAKLQDQLLTDYQLPIKQKLLGAVKKQAPSLRGTDPKAIGGYDGIEGIILTDPTTGEKFKVVDKGEFTTVNKFNYEVRKRIIGRIMTADDNKPLESRGGLVGIAKTRCIKLFGLPGAELPNQAKKVLAPFRGNTEDETISNIASNLKQLNYQSAKRKVGAIMTSCLSEIDEALEKFKKDVASMELKLKDGQVIKYTPEIKRRTLLTFGEAIKEVYEMLKDIRASQNMDDLLKVFFNDYIRGIHSENEDA